MVMVQEAVALAIVTALKATVSGVPCVTTLLPAQPAPKVIVGAAEVQRRDAGRLSVKAIPDCAGLVPLLVSVSTRLVVAPSLMVAVLQALVRVGATVLTTTHWPVTPLVTLVVPVMLAAALVNAAGLPAQLALT